MMVLAEARLDRRIAPFEEYKPCTQASLRHTSHAMLVCLVQEKDGIGKKEEI